MELIKKSNVDLTSGYLFDKSELNRKITINAVYNQFYNTGRVNAFKFNWREGMENKPHVFWDSDVAKWIEGAANILKKHENKELLDKVESIIDDIEKNQCDDGYFNIYFQAIEPSKRYTNRHDHELYCAGHLMEAAVAYYDATGRDRFLKLMEKYADYIEKVFVKENSAVFQTPGHEEIELALVRLYEATGKKKYLDLSKFFIDQRGNNEKDKPFDSYMWQSHIPVREQKKAIGHCVRAAYLYSGMVDIAKAYNDEELISVCKELADDIITKKMYITGGIGSTHRGEAFSFPYDLPNETAYNETCAAISLIFFMQRMLTLENNAKYADIIERTLYNATFSGISLNGKEFFYENPLAINVQNHHKEEHENNDYPHLHFPITQRVEVFWCSCCPPNINRFLSSLDDYIYGADNDTYYINQFTSSKMEHNGAYIEQITNYPVSGDITIKTNNVKTLMIRKPYWCDEFKINAEYELENGYIKITNPSETINVSFVMTPQLICADSRVYNVNAKAAVCYGPIVYCAEAVDNGEILQALFLDSSNTNFDIKYSEEFGLNTLSIDGLRRMPSTELYYKYSDTFEKTTIKLIPYSCFANRGETDMLVWLNVK